MLIECKDTTNPEIIAISCQSMEVRFILTILQNQKKLQFSLHFAIISKHVYLIKLNMY